MCVWYVSHVEKNIGKQGTKAVNTPFGEAPNPIAAVSHRLANVQFRESIPWLLIVQYQVSHQGVS